LEAAGIILEAGCRVSNIILRRGNGFIAAARLILIKGDECMRGRARPDYENGSWGVAAPKRARGSKKFITDALERWHMLITIPKPERKSTRGPSWECGRAEKYCCARFAFPLALSEP